MKFNFALIMEASIIYVKGEDSIIQAIMVFRFLPAFFHVILF